MRAVAAVALASVLVATSAYTLDPELRGDVGAAPAQPGSAGSEETRRCQKAAYDSMNSTCDGLDEEHMRWVRGRP